MAHKRRFKALADLLAAACLTYVLRMLPLWGSASMGLSLLPRHSHTAARLAPLCGKLLEASLTHSPHNPSPLPAVATVSLRLEIVIADVFILVCLLPGLPRSRRFSALLDFPGLSPLAGLCLQMDVWSDRWCRPALRWRLTECQVLC